ncbi:unnamed protein product [Durusdinium trenchii]|uniref:Uncharacterized protein n=1 Tax=Durusdinium trenchii TaxID=1381693 RepID=A0ABP0RQR9_9DINO
MSGETPATRPQLVALLRRAVAEVYLRSAAMAHPFPDTSMCEDVDFLLRLKEVYQHRVGLKRDEEGICLHLMHGGNTADSMLHQSVSAQKFAQLHVSKLQFPFMALSRDLQEHQSEAKMGRFFVKAETEERMRQFQRTIQEEAQVAAHRERIIFE